MHLTQEIWVSASQIGDHPEFMVADSLETFYFGKFFESSNLGRSLEDPGTVVLIVGI